MTVTCPYCKRKFHKGKTNEFSRMTKHIWKEHSDTHRKRIKKGKKKPREVLEQELMLTDDLMLALLLEVDERIRRLEGHPTQHQDAVGLVIDTIKEALSHRGERPKSRLGHALLGPLGYKAVKGKYVKKK